ncbi:MAG: hypothetical protein JNM43_03845 [Planctomycetaceae bacterium]|nr:hypothetical protein [Planctomycetaceae bacterium]
MSLQFSRTLSLSANGADADPWPLRCGSWVGFASFSETVRDWRQVPEIVQCYSRLSDASRRRCDRFRSVHRQTQFLLARCIVQNILRKELNVRLDDLQFHQLDNGQPVLCRGDQQIPLRISLAHSGNVAAAVVSSEAISAGIDIELQERLSVPALQFMLSDTSEMSSTSSASSLLPGDESGMKAEEWRLRKEWIRREARWKALGGPSTISILEMSATRNEFDHESPRTRSLPSLPASFLYLSSDATHDSDFCVTMSDFSCTTPFVACVCQIRD